MRTSVIAAVIVLAELLAARAAAAHAFLARADPRVGASVAQAPATLRLSFTEGVVPALSHVTIAGPAGFGGAAPARAAPGDPKGLVIDLRSPVPAGTYAVRWRVTAADTHVTEGAYTFKVAP